MVRIAIVGAGWQGQGLLASLAAISDAELAGVCDINPQVLAKVCSKYGAEGFTDYTEMLEKTRPDGVLICTHPQMRLPIIAAAAERGVHCFIEKPPAQDMESAGQIQAVIEKHGILSSVGFMYRYSPAVTKTRELLEGRRVALVRSCMLDGLAVREGTPAWFFDKSRSKGPVFDQAIHIFDLSRYLLGEITSVFGFQGNLTVPQSETFTVEDSAALVFQYKNGIIQNHTHSWAYSGFKAQLQFISDELDLVLDLGEGTVQGTIGGETVNFAETAALYQLELEAFVQAIREGDPRHIRCTYRDGMSSLAFALAAVRALESGTAVQLNA